MLVAAQDAREVHAQEEQRRLVGGRLQPRGHLLVVGPDQAEDKAAVRQGQQITQEEGQAGVEALGQLRVLGAEGLSAHPTRPITHMPH